MLRGRWFDSILNVHAPTKDKSGDSNNNFNEKLMQVINQFSKYHIKIMLREVTAKLGRAGISKLTIWNDSLHENSSDKDVPAINFATSENLIFKSTILALNHS
jgi:hypothetical protein